MIQDHEVPILISRESDDHQRREEWMFFASIRFNRLELILHSYTSYDRGSRYGVMKIIAGWARTPDLAHNLKEAWMLMPSEVPEPADVWDEACAKLCTETLEYSAGRWHRWNTCIARTR